MNKVLCGDAFEVIAEIEKESVDLVVTSPPYNLDIKYVGYSDSVAWEKYEYDMQMTSSHPLKQGVSCE